jgi:hypothetical protein
MAYKYRHLIFIIVFAGWAFSEELPALVIVSPQGPVFQQAIEGLNNELVKSFSLTKIVFDSSLTDAAFTAKITAVSPKAIILMGNKPIRYYKECIKSDKNNLIGLPVIALLASQMEQAIDGLSNVQGIAYETPMVTALINFRNVINRPIQTVGVIFRGIFEGFVKQHIDYCKKEKIEVKSILIGNDPKSQKQEIQRALQHLISKDNTEVVWVPNDNILLKPDILGEIWIPTFSKHKIPVIVGVESLVRPELDFGAYAVIPDPKALGEQAAGIVFDLQSSDWKFDRTIVYPALSVYSVLNMKKVEALNGTFKINYSEVTKLLKEGN